MNGLMFNIMLVGLLKIVIAIFVLGLISGFIPLIGGWMKIAVSSIFHYGEGFSSKIVPWGKNKKENKKE